MRPAGGLRLHSHVADMCGHHSARLTILQRILALTAAIWHNGHASQPIMRSLIAYDH